MPNSKKRVTHSDTVQTDQTYSKYDYQRSYKDYNYNNAHTYPDSWGSNWNRDAYYAPNSNIYGTGTGGYGNSSSGYGSSTSTNSYNPSSSYGSGGGYGSSASSYNPSGSSYGKGGSKKTRRKTTKRRK